ncbi:MAG: hypothetical protein QW625_03815 [Candidatus Nanoarchaeia archaeon]
MSELKEIEDALKYAQFLIDRGYCDAATKHLFRGANKLVHLYLNLPRFASISPILASQKLSSGNEVEKRFAEDFLKIWKLFIRPDVTKEEVLNAYKSLKSFLEYYKSTR